MFQALLHLCTRKASFKKLYTRRRKNEMGCFLLQLPLIGFQVQISIYQFEGLKMHVLFLLNSKKKMLN